MRTIAPPAAPPAIAPVLDLLVFFWTVLPELEPAPEAEVVPEFALDFAPAFVADVGGEEDVLLPETTLPPVEVLSYLSIKLRLRGLNEEIPALGLVISDID